MSNLEPDPEGTDLSAAPGVHHAAAVPDPRKAAIGDGTEVRRNVTLATCPDFEYGNGRLRARLGHFAQWRD